MCVGHLPDFGETKWGLQITCVDNTGNKGIFYIIWMYSLYIKTIDTHKTSTSTIKYIFVYCPNMRLIKTCKNKPL